MATKQKIQNDYINHVLTEGKKPATVFAFAKKNKFQEEEFYKHFGSFDGIEAEVWADLFRQTIKEIKSQEVWGTYSAREKALSFFYSFFELLKSNRSFVNYSTGHFKKGLHTPVQLKESKTAFEEFSIEIIQEGLETGEITDRKFISDRYKDALWMQLAFVLKFWLKDYSAGFEKTDEAIEKGVNVTFDLFQRTPIDNLLDYGKFLAQNAGFKMSF
ncbi:TetR/AcrR family transcriptional regulator [Pedobacter sp. SD-b]|uniref:TetR/AcrR family transcriptional regulator n=1 Tax=Pedobacter segetis TaxID=2793069 RepID=A0ABS1BKD9_9SPHI|nr:TetR family transcriptional regulator C-terminal domain-containing protein [Pedobacter segetis]MBK0383360.1 TetR/AcrR family transcriptional regulator [Pedobacter segetis]